MFARTALRTRSHYTRTPSSRARASPAAVSVKGAAGLLYVRRTSPSRSILLSQRDGVRMQYSRPWSSAAAARASSEPLRHSHAIAYRAGQHTSAPSSPCCWPLPTAMTAPPPPSRGVLREHGAFPDAEEAIGALCSTLASPAASR